ncbi:hypothetical protein BH10ACI3_BH10ACI3_18960 [soil metagenome]
MQNDNAQSLAARIAKLIASESASTDLAAIQKSLDSLHTRLDKLESVSVFPPIAVHPTILNHPSQDRFEIAEAIVDSLFDSTFKEKACTFETSKPCDHCSMCSSRGF